MKRIFWIFVFAASVCAQEAIITDVTGSAFLSSQGIWKKAAPQTVVRAGDSITTEIGAEVTLSFAAGHTVKISGNSIFSIEKNEENLKELDLWLGELSAKVQKLAPSQKFRVYTPAAVCAVRGTKFDVSVSEDKRTEVYVSDGIVGVMDRSGLGEEVFVEKGMMTSVAPGEAALPPKAGKKPEAKKAAKPEAGKKKEVKEAEVGAPVEGAFEQPIPSPEKKKPSPKTAGKVNFNGSVGAVALTDPKTGETKVYYEFSMYPEISLGKLGIGLELVVHFDENNQILKDEWDDWSDLYSKIDYIRWGVKHRDPFYFLIGRFRKPVTIGHGMIVNGYTNMAQYPNMRKIGLEFDLDRGKWGMEGMVGDLRWREILAGRFYFRPLLFTGIPVVKNLKLGASAGTDVDPDSNSKTKNDAVTVVGADAELPLLTYRIFNATVFADWAKMQPGSTYTDYGNISDEGLSGQSVGISGKLLFLKYRGEYRKTDNNFIPGYFDSYYDIDRWKYYSAFSSTMTKAEYYLAGKGKDPVKVGPYFEAWFDIFNLATFRASYENYNVHDNDPYYPHLIAHAVLNKVPALTQYTFEADYDKRSARTWSDITEVDKNAILSLKVGYNVAPNVTMYVVVRRNFDSSGNETKTMTAETRMRF
ncbi:MAG: FecR domain-containing protein [Elusimicrobia bacterium]|nr:FecR domain-containing protein [Elusimicrobiota bacterium]